MDEETRQEFNHQRDNFKKVFEKQDELKECLTEHVLEDSNNFSDLTNKMSLMTLGGQNHERESAQRVRSVTERVERHELEHAARKKVMLTIVAPLIVAALIVMGTTVWNSIKAAGDAQKVLEEIKKQNGGQG